MSKCPGYEWVPAAAAEIDKEYTGYTGGPHGPNATCWCKIINKGNGIGWTWGKEEQAVSGIISYKRDFNWQEEAAWYREHFDINNHITSNNLIGLFTDLYDVGDAYHEMWNGWVGTDFYEMTGELEDEDFYLLGIAPAPWDKDDVFGKGNSVAFVGCYYSTDERFWCHGSKDWVKFMRDQMEEIYKEIAI